MFESKKHRRFLMHLVGHHVQINVRQTYIYGKVTDQSSNEPKQNFYSQVGLLLGYVNHSCSPNATPIDRDGDTVYIAVRPIDAGQEVVISNYSFHWDPAIQWHPQTEGFSCHCERCEHRLPSIYQVAALASEPDFRYINSINLNLTHDCIDQDTHDDLKVRCIKLLKRYGRMLWCREFGIVLQLFNELNKAEMHGMVLETDDNLNNN